MALHLQAPNWVDFLGGGAEPTRMGAGQPHSAPAAEVVPTRDGHIVLSAYAEEHWARFCRAMGREALITDPRFCSNAQRVVHRQALRAVLCECLSALSSEQCVALLTRHHIVAGAVRTYGQALASPDVVASGIVVQARSPDGTSYRSLGLPYQLGSGTRPAPDAAPPAGADSQALLEEAGYSVDEIGALRRDGVTV